MSDRLRIAWYGLTIFLSSAFLLVLEILAGRLIAPYVGVSLYTWTAIIGVILAGLSLGNWLGGIWADRGGKELAAGITLALAGLFSLGILALLTLVAPLIEARAMTLLGASFFYVLALFFMPAVLLGVVTPLLTTLALGLDRRTGHIVGRMHALAALGSILGTFLTGYLLIQYLGTRGIVIGTALGLFLLALPFFKGTSRLVPAAVLAAAVGLVLLTQARNGFSNPCDRESTYFCIRVVDESERAPFGVARSLVLDHLVHGTNHESEPGLLLAPYVQLMDKARAGALRRREGRVAALVLRRRRRLHPAALGAGTDTRRGRHGGGVGSPGHAHGRRSVVSRHRGHACGPRGRADRPGA